MSGYEHILSKLNTFTRKFYLKQLVKGLLLFLSLGLLSWIVVTTFEYLLWLDGSWRLILFLAFVAVELFLLFRFIIVPLIYLLQLRKGLSNKQASRLIGKHFAEVDDKLLNLLDLAESKEKSELLLASIEQRAMALGKVPFADAINIKENLKYGKYAVIPLVLLGLIWVSGNIASFFDSHQRVVNYDLAFERPAPFHFVLLNDKLEVLDNESLRIQVGVRGDFIPEEVYMVIEGEELLMKNESGVFTHTIQAPVPEGSFFLTANGWNSRAYNFKSFATPAVLDFKMELRFPNYLNRQNESISGTGNAVIPEGTTVTWKIKGKNVDQIILQQADSSSMLMNKGDMFEETRTLFKDFSYQLNTSNTHIQNFEKLAYNVGVVKDGRPTIKVEQFLDSLNPNQSFYSGQAADDYGIRNIRLIYYPVDDKENWAKLMLENPNSNVHQFYYTFPSGLKLEAGRDYELYFEAVDNDGIRNGKAVRSQVFRTSLFNRKQLINKELEYQNSLLNNMDRELENYKEQRKELTNLNKEQKEERTLSFENKGRIRNLLEKQERQEELMQKFSSKLKDNLDKNEGDEEMKQLLKERLERQEKEAARNQKLLEELNKLADKIEKEELQRKLEEVAKKQSSSARNLEQILELTKRYYVSEKASQLGRELEELAGKQQELSEEKDEKSLEKQKKLNEEFNSISKELDELKQDNENLKKPLDIEVEEREQQGVKEDQEQATEQLSKAKESSQEAGKDAEKKASSKQQSAAEKMKEMSEKLQESAMSGGGSSDTEDAEMLRQILDNLVTFSFKQENLFDRLEASDFEIDNFSNTVKEQKELRRMFEHVDDSLFALSLRRVELSEFVNEQITEVYYNTDKSLESIAESQIYRGASYQQYVMNAANTLADFLANILDNMQQNMQSGQGQGQGADFQLPDIIQGQQGIQEKMQGSGQSKQGEQSGEQEGKEGQQNEGKGEQSGKSGGNKGEKESGKDGNKGDGDGGEGDGFGDEMGLKEIYEIYKQQQFLRQQLENQLKDMIDNADRGLAKKLIRQMEDFENDLLENGITDRTRNKANNIQHQLLKLKDAELKQGETNERESRVGTQEFENPITTKPDQLKEVQNRIEILNRQALPLRQNYEKKVKVYFRND